jgi:hypothetical protein
LYENGFPVRNQDLRGFRADATIASMPDNRMPRRETRSEPRGPHWIAWRTDADGKPEGAIVIVGETREEAELRAAEWENPSPR